MSIKRLQPNCSVGQALSPANPACGCPASEPETRRRAVAASLAGRKGVVRIDPDRRADLFLSGPGIVGLAFTPSRSMVVATTNAIHRVDVGIKGRPLY